jgi:hypothetical protein
MWDLYILPLPFFYLFYFLYFFLQHLPLSLVADDWAWSRGCRVHIARARPWGRLVAKHRCEVGQSLRTCKLRSVMWPELRPTCGVAEGSRDRHQA